MSEIEKRIFPDSLSESAEDSNFRLAFAIEWRKDDLELAKKHPGYASPACHWVCVDGCWKWQAI